ncbi:MAG TPA: hypothetical protein VFE65_36650 [Pseudonocardia sp.]|jgi:hypothetical protein|nr:hypothetical protein [Pseudonocardia sp.]
MGIRGRQFVGIGQRRNARQESWRANVVERGLAEGPDDVEGTAE